MAKGFKSFEAKGISVEAESENPIVVAYDKASSDAFDFAAIHAH